jgi:hypothetical protein
LGGFGGCTSEVFRKTKLVEKALLKEAEERRRERGIKNHLKNNGKATIDE